MNKKKNEFLFIGCFIFFTFLLCIGVNYKKNSKIDKIFKSNAYSYLSPIVKEYIKDVYEDTGKIILTEKNKEENEPYLNPKYVEYLNLTDDEKQNVQLIPEPLILDYLVNSNYTSLNLPSSYDLRNIDGKNYVSKVKDQGDLGICWAFASIENVETLLMKQSEKSYSDETLNFSVRQMDYATSINKLIKKYVDTSISHCDPISSCRYYSYTNPDNGSRELGSGGNFFTASIIMSNGLSLVDESILPWNEENSVYWPKDIFSYDNSKYEVNSSIVMPVINEDDVSLEIINSYVSEIKKYIMQYGGPFVGTYSPLSTCGFENIDGTKTLKTDDCIKDSLNKDMGHAMQIIGWDDDYSYSYCEVGTKHYAVENGSCNAGDLKTGKGAWILKNSWGEDNEEKRLYKYVYLTYDSTRLSVGFTTSVSSMENRSWDNNYHSNPWIDGKLEKGMASIDGQTKIFNTHNKKLEKVEKIKILTSSKNGTYNISIISGDNNYSDIATISTNEVGIYTIDLSDKNIILDNGEFEVTVVGNDNSKFYNDSISVFTSNIDLSNYVTTYSDNAYDETKPLSDENPLYVKGESAWYLNIDVYLKNLPSNVNLTYRVEKDGVIATDKQIGCEFSKTVINDIADAYFSGRTSCHNSKFNTNEAYGETYRFEILSGDTVVDSFPIKFNGQGKTTSSTVRFNANDGTDNYKDKTVSDETTRTISDLTEYITFFNHGYHIIGWNTNADGSGQFYNNDDEILVYHDMELYAVWEENEYLITFNSNNGLDEIITQNTNGASDKLLKNSFEKEGYEFIGWNTNIDGTGTSYSDCQIVNINADLVLYAQWVENKHNITFDANGGIGNMDIQKIEHNTLVVLNKNNFTKEGYMFVKWNTSVDGSGTSYFDCDEVIFNDDIILYAIWQEETDYIINKYEIDETNKYVDDININTTVDDFKKNIILNDDYTVFVDYKIVDDKNLVYTGGKLKIYKGSDLVGEYTNIIRGDVNGDGKINYLDYVSVYNHIQKQKHPELDKHLLVNEYLVSADISKDNNVNYLDYVRIYNKIKELKGGSN